MGRTEELMSELQEIMDRKSVCGISSCDEPDVGWTEIVHNSVVIGTGIDSGRPLTIPICQDHSDQLKSRS